MAICRMGGLCASHALGGTREADVSTEPSPAREDARVPRAHVDEGRSEGAEAPARQGPAATDGLVGAGRAARPREAPAGGAAPVPTGVRPTLPARSARGESRVRPAVAAGAWPAGRGIRRRSAARRQRGAKPSPATPPRGVPTTADPRASGGSPAVLHRTLRRLDPSVRRAAGRDGGCPRPDSPALDD